MSCRLLNQIFRVAQTNHLHPVLYKIMLNALPNNNSLLKNTTTSFYTILTSNLYKNHNLAKQKNALKCSARLESDINCNNQAKKAKACKPPKKKTSKLKYAEIRVCQSDDKCKEKMICICMPISKFKEMRSKTKLIEEESHKNAEFKKCKSVICTKPSPAFCWIPPQKKPCPVQTWILRRASKYVVPFLSKAKKSNTIAPERKALQSACLMKPLSSTNYAPSKQPSQANYCAAQKQPLKKAGSAYNCVPAKQSGAINCAQNKQPKSNMCPPKSPALANNCNPPKQPGLTNKQPKQPGSSSISGPPKQPAKHIKN